MVGEVYFFFLLKTLFQSNEDVCKQLMCTKLHQGRSLCISSMMNQPADGTQCDKNKVSIEMIQKRKTRFIIG